MIPLGYAVGGHAANPHLLIECPITASMLMVLSNGIWLSSARISHFSAFTPVDVKRKSAHAHRKEG